LGVGDPLTSGNAFAQRSALVRETVHTRMTFDQLIATASSKGASDIHLRAGYAPLVRVHGDLHRWTSVSP
jgi:Tfp pilus assembly pilus retraction ATPase PilT